MALNQRFFMSSVGMSYVDKELATLKATLKRLFSFIISRKLEANEPIFL